MSDSITPDELKCIMTGVTMDDWRSQAPFLSITPAQQVTYEPFSDSEIYTEFTNKLYPNLTADEYKKCAYIAGVYLSGDMTLMDHIQPIMFLLALNMKSHNNDHTKVVKIFKFALASPTEKVDYQINGKTYDVYINEVYNDLISKPLTTDHMVNLIEPLIIEEKSDRIIAQIGTPEIEKEAVLIARWVKFLTDIMNSVGVIQKCTADKYANAIAALCLSMFQGLWKNKVSVQQAVVNSYRCNLSKFFDLPSSDFGSLAVHGKAIEASCSVMYDRSYEAKVLLAACYMVTVLIKMDSTTVYIQELKYMIRVIKAGFLVRAEYFGMALLKLFMVIFQKTRIGLGQLVSALSIGPFEKIMSTWYYTIKAVTKEYEINVMLAKCKSAWGSATSQYPMGNLEFKITAPTGWIFARLFDTTKMGQFRPSESPQLYLAIAQCALKIDPSQDIDEAYAYKQYSQLDMTIAGLMREALLNVIFDTSSVNTVQPTDHQLPAITKKMISEVGQIKASMANNPEVRANIAEFTVNKRSKVAGDAKGIKVIKITDGEAEVSEQVFVQTMSSQPPPEGSNEQTETEQLSVSDEQAAGPSNAPQGDMSDSDSDDGMDKVDLNDSDDGMDKITI